MKRLLFFLILFLPVLTFGQSVSSQIKTDRIYSRIGRGISLYDTVFIKKGIAADSLETIGGVVCRNTSDGRLVLVSFNQFVDSIGGAYVVGDTIFIGGDTLIGTVQHWTKTVNDIENNNTGKVILPGDSTFFDAMPDVGTKVGRILHVNQYKEIEYITPTSLGDRIDSGRAASPTAYTTWVRDDTYGMLSPATEMDKASESSLNDPFYNLVYWKKDFINAYFYSVNNAKIGFIGDSYTLPYSEKLKKETEAVYGYGGGYESLISNVAYADYGTYVSGWTFVSIRTDRYITHSRAARSITNGNVLKLSAFEFNNLKLHYRTRTAGGSFSVKKNYNGTLDTVSTAAAAGDNWFVKDYGSLTCNIYDTIIITKIGTDTVDIYGFQFEMNPYSETVNFETQNKRLEISIMPDGGANLDDFYTDKDTATLHSLLDTLDLSLLCIVNLDDPSTVETQLDSLIGLFRILRPEMDICVLSSHDDKSGYGDSTRRIMEKVAKLNKAGYIDVFNSVGRRADLYATGASTDSVHLAGFGRYLPYYAIRKNIFPDPTEQDMLTAYNLKIMGNQAMIKPNGTNFIFTTKPQKSSLTGANNTGFGYRVIEANTTGYSNMAFGSECLLVNTTGYSNVALGYFGLRANTTGHENIAMGANALAQIIGSHNNIGIGTFALYGIVSGTGNTTVGDRSFITTTGSYNAGLGVEAGRYPTGTNNTALGAFALRGAAAGSSAADNTAIGKNSFYSITTGTLNSGLGENTGYSNTTGAGNTAIGANALYSNLTGSYNIALGFRSGYNELGSKKFYVAWDSTSWANGMASGSHLLIYADQSNAAKASHFMNIFAKVSIGAAKDPTSMLEVTGNATVTGSFKSGTGAVADNDLTPDVSGYNTFIYVGSANSVAPTDLDNPVVGAYYTFIGNSDTYTLNFPGSTNFKMAGAGKNLGQYDNITFYCQADNLYIMVGYNDIIP